MARHNERLIAAGLSQGVFRRLYVASIQQYRPGGPAFPRYRAEYLDDDAFLNLQHPMMKHPAAGDVIEGTGGLRKLRHCDSRRGNGKRGGLRVVYYWWDGGSQFWLFTPFDKGEMKDLSARAKQALKGMLEHERKIRL